MVFSGTWEGTDFVDGSPIAMTIDGDSLAVVIRYEVAVVCEEEFGELVSAEAVGNATAIGGELVVRSTLTCNLAFGRETHPDWIDREHVFLFDAATATLDGLDACWHRPEQPAACGP